MPKSQVNSATLIMGVTGSGKSSLLATLARYVWEVHQKVTLLYTCDGGGFPAEIQALIDAGIIWVFRMRTRDPGDLGLSFETCQRACQGWWPRKIKPATGEVPPGVEMVPPIVKRWEMRCPHHPDLPQAPVVKSVVAQSLLTPASCPVCKKIVTKTDMLVTESLQPSTGFEKVGAVAYDGLTSMLSWGAQELGHRAGRMELKGEEGAIGGKVQSGELKFGGSTRSHIGFMQARGEEFVHLTLGIPNLVVPPIFTALTMEADDDQNLAVVGPKISGRAKTDEAPQWFGNCLETAKIPNPNGKGEIFVLNIEEYTDEAGRRHLCKHRGSPGTMPPSLQDPPNGEHPFSEFNLGKFFTLLDQALASRIADVRKEIPNAPGLPAEDFVEFGDGNRTVQGTAPAVEGAPAAASAAPSAPPAAPRAQAPKPRAPRAAASKAPVAVSPAAPATETPSDEASNGVVTPAEATLSPEAPAPPPAAAATPAQPAAPTPAPKPVASAAPATVRSPVAPPAGARPRPATPVVGMAPKPPAGAPRPPAAVPVPKPPTT